MQHNAALPRKLKGYCHNQLPQCTHTPEPRTPHVAARGSYKGKKGKLDSCEWWAYASRLVRVVCCFLDIVLSGIFARYNTLSGG